MFCFEKRARVEIDLLFDMKRVKGFVDRKKDTKCNDEIFCIYHIILLSIAPLIMWKFTYIKWPNTINMILWNLFVLFILRKISVHIGLKKTYFKFINIFRKIFSCTKHTLPFLLNCVLGMKKTGPLITNHA